MVEYNSCLVVSRHKLLPLQEKDVESICKNVFITAELETDQKKLFEHIKPYDVVIGSIPLQLQIPIIQSGKALITFVMKSIGTVENKEDAEAIAMRYPERATILTSSKEGEKYRVVMYEGLKLIKEIKVIDEWIVQHPS